MLTVAQFAQCCRSQALAGAHLPPLPGPAGLLRPLPPLRPPDPLAAPLLPGVRPPRVPQLHGPQCDGGETRVPHLQCGGGPPTRPHLDIRQQAPGQVLIQSRRLGSGAADYIPRCGQVCADFLRIEQDLIIENVTEAFSQSPRRAQCGMARSVASRGMSRVW